MTDPGHIAWIVALVCGAIYILVYAIEDDTRSDMARADEDNHTVPPRRKP